MLEWLFSLDEKPRLDSDSGPHENAKTATARGRRKNEQHTYIKGKKESRTDNAVNFIPHSSYYKITKTTTTTTKRRKRSARIFLFPLLLKK